MAKPNRTWQFGLGRILLVITATAVFLALFDWKNWPVSSAAVCVGLGTAAAMLPARWLQAMAVVLPCAYAPYFWLLGNDMQNDYHWSWIGMWPILPGLLPGAALFHTWHSYLELPCMAAATLAMLWVAIALVNFRGWLRVAVAMTVTSLSIINSLIAYALFRA